MANVNITLIAVRIFSHVCFVPTCVANVFKGVFDNPLFCGILVVTSILQALIVQFGSVTFHVSKGGLDAKYWGISLAFGAGALPVPQVINLLYRVGQRYKGYRMKRRLQRNTTLSQLEMSMVILEVSKDRFCNAQELEDNNEDAAYDDELDDES
jgi:hypothetical protein